jgi:hypothetical protein
MSKNMFEELKAILDTEEGMEKSKRWFDKINNEKAIYNSQLERAFKRYGLNISSVVEKIINKYESDKYRDFWWNKGFEPPESLYFFLYDYAAKYGSLVDENSPIEQQNCGNEFSSDLYYLDNFVFNKMYGQGSCVLIHKIK